MKLSNIQKKLDPNILEKGRKSLKLKCMYPFFWMFISLIIIIPFANGLDNFFSNDDWFLYYVLFISLTPNCVGVYFIFTDVYIKYFIRISVSLKINQYGLRPFTIEEIDFIKKNFKKVKWKSSLNIAQNLKDEAQIYALQDKELEKDYIVNTNFTEIDDIEMKKLQTLYYVIIGVSGVIIYSFINA